MQSPTPPTKPTPPTPPNPPSIKTSTATPSTDTHFLSTAKEQSAPIPASADTSTNNLPPMASFSTSNHTSKETTSETAIPSTTKLSTNSSSSTGFSVFFVLIFIIAITLVAVHWWKISKPKQGAVIDYSTESSDEIVNLIFSQSTPESVPQGISTTTMSKKIIPKAEPTTKSKGNFEVRV